MNALQAWIAQNRYWLRSLFTLVIITFTFACMVYKIGLSGVTYWSTTIALEHVDREKLESKLVTERALKDAVSASIDSLELELGASALPGEILQFLRDQAVESGLTLASFDQQGSSESAAKSIRLIVEGPYFALGNFVTAVEKSFSGVTIVELDLIEQNPGKGTLNAAITLRGISE